MSDRFRFYSQSADVAPGKGAGETLVSPPSTYAELAKIPNWRRLLAAGDLSPLPLTGQAELYEGAPRKPIVRRTDLEEARQSDVKRQGNVSEQTDSMEATKKPRGKKVAPAPVPQEEGSGSNAVTNIPPSVYVNSLPTEEQDFSAPDLDEKEDTSTIHFCPVCRNYLFAQIQFGTDESTQTLVRMCRNCGYQQTNLKGGLVSELTVGQRSAESYKILLNEFTPDDPRLPHIHGTIKCPDPGCPSNKAGQESDIIYMKYDPVNLNFLYICYICKYKWHSTR